MASLAICWAQIQNFWKELGKGKEIRGRDDQASDRLRNALLRRACWSPFRPQSLASLTVSHGCASASSPLKS